MADYTYQKEVDTTLLVYQIEASSIITQSPTGVVTSGENLTISFDVALSGGEETELNSIVSNHNPLDGGQYSPNHKKETYTKSKLTKEEWFETCDSQGNLSGLSKSIDYTWSGTTMLSRLEKQYFKGGLVFNQQQYQYFTISGNRVERKV